MNEADMEYFNKLNDIYQDPSTSVWLRDAIKSGLRRDPVDMLNDIDVLNDLFTLKNQMAQEQAS